MLAYDSATLEQAWKSYAPNQSVPALALSLDGSLLYGVYPKNANGCDNAPSGLTLVIWETKTGQVTREIDLDRQMHVPQATCGRGGAAYLTMSRDGTNLFLVWEDKLWRLETGDLRVTHELRLPFAVDGIALSVDGRELYLLPSTSGDLRARGHGLMTVNTHLFQLIRQAQDWDKTMVQPFMFTAPAP